MRKLGFALVTAWLLAAGIAPAGAHHSFASYDMTRTESVTGALREFRWTNPHIWILVAAPNGKGGMHDVGIEGGSVVGLKREGWSKDVFKPGDKVTISFHPHKDGTPGGALVQAITASGQTLGKPDRQLTTPTAPAQAAPAPAGAPAPPKK